MEYLHDCITELQKSTKERNSEKIIKYIQSLSSFMLLIKEEQNRNRDHLENTVKILHYIRKEKNNIIVREGEKGNEFFLILRGKVAILVFQPEYYNMTEEEYVLHLLKLKRNNENECIKQTIINNQLIYPMEENFDILFKGLIQRKTKGGVYLENENILKKADEVYSYLKSKNFKENRKISPNDYIKINRIDNSILENNGLNYDDKGNKRNKVLIMSYHLVNYFETGQTFGEVALQNISSKRIATVISIEDCDIVYIVRKEYNLLIKNSIERNVKNFYSVIYSFNLFKFISRYTFNKCYYNYFVYKKFNKGNYLIVQEENCNDVFFIFKGEFEIFTERNILEVNNLLIIYKKKLLELLNQNEKEYNNKEEKENDDLILNKKFKSIESNKILFERRKINIGIFKDREIIGLSDCCYLYEKKYLKGGLIENIRRGCITCKCISITGDAYNVSQKFFDKMINDEHSIMRLKGEFEIKKLKLFIETLENHKKRIYEEINNKNNEISKEYYFLALKEKNLTQKNRLYNFENNAKILKEGLKNKINNGENEKKNFLFKKHNYLNKLYQSKNRNLYKISLNLPKISFPENQEIIDKNPNFIHKFKRKSPLNKDKYKLDLLSRNLYDGVFHSYLTTNNFNSNIMKNKSQNNLIRKKKNNKKNLTMSSDEEIKNQINFSSNKNYSFKSNKEIGIYDMLILDKFNSCFNLAMKTFSNEK